MKRKTILNSKSILLLITTIVLIAFFIVCCIPGPTSWLETGKWDAGLWDDCTWGP